MLNKYIEQTEKKEVKQWIQTTLNKYLKNNAENVGEIEHIIDYLNSNAAPKRLRKMSYAQAKISSEKWLKAQSKKGNNIEESDFDTETIIKWKSGIRLVKLIGENSFKREGFLMSHCVASYYGKSDVAIYSLRDTKNKPHCTIEVMTKNNSINQIKGKGNGKIHPKYIKYIIKILTKVFKMNVRESEMSNLGYSLPPKGYIDFFKNKGVEITTFKFKDNEYIYVK